ncbi:RNA polymerase sigma factor [Wenjunlia tyrosinilytica]|uniref:RNA polymerase sigma24 factor n=1 Tax=Wenjunlia tyrosinilytica TaxID=1544741 RepID=A0A917ZKD5_9ACTN|nr:sigma-70 family RNA polymerase sigma factor [Wenjunlia tyrosinilytica]GGO84290.1 RNA polymerase sigma24 factor [Wenjunlia tyrosinilytica]
MGIDAAGEALVVRRLMDGDEDALTSLMDSWSPVMLRLARMHVNTVQSAEDTVQETWLAVLHGLERFERRSSLRTWVFRILLNKAKSCGVREHRTVPTAALDGQGGGPVPDPRRLRRSGGGREDPWPEPWAVLPLPWPTTPEGELLAAEARRVLAAELGRLPPRQRAVIELRDLYGYSAEETCRMLRVSKANQRVLLHRARAGLRSRVEGYFGALAMEVG